MFQNLTNVLGPNEVTLNLINYITSILEVEVKSQHKVETDSKEGEVEDDIITRVKNADEESEEEEKTTVQTET